MAARVIVQGEAYGLDAIALLNRPVYLAYDELVAAAGPGGHARFFAWPAEEHGTIAWATDLDGPVRRWSEMSPVEQAIAEQTRRTIRAALASRMALLEHSGPDPRDAAAAELIRFALNVPGPDAVFVVGTHPVLTFWGFARRNEAAFDPFAPIALRPAPAAALLRADRRILRLLLTVLLSIICLAAAGLYLALGPQHRTPVPLSSPLPAMPATSRQVRPIPEPLPPPRPSSPVPELPPRTISPGLGDRLKLPSDSADLSFLKGRWSVESGLTWGNISHEEPVEMALNLDGDGGGTVSIYRTGPPQVCSSPVEAHRAGDTLTLQSRFRLRCPDASLMTSLRITCFQQDDGSALCHGVNLPGGNPFETRISKMPD